MCGHHRPAAPVEDRDLERGLHLTADGIGKRLRRNAEARRKQRVAALPQPDAGVATLRAHRPDAVHKGMLHQQHGRGVLAAKGCQPGQFADVFQIQLAQRGGGVQPQADGLGRGGVGRGPGIDGLPERGKIFFLYLNARRGGVAAEPRQILCAVCERTVQVERVRPSPSCIEMTMTGRLNRSMSRAATMPMTPGCQSSPLTTSTRSRVRAGSASNACKAAAKTCCSVCWRSVLISARRSAMPVA